MTPMCGASEVSDLVSGVIAPTELVTKSLAILSTESEGPWYGPHGPSSAHLI
jgi:hypothetical protein